MNRERPTVRTAMLAMLAIVYWFHVGGHWFNAGVGSVNNTEMPTGPHLSDGYPGIFTDDPRGGQDRRNNP